MTTFATRTGSLGIGFRTLGWADWCKDVPGMTAWAREHGFACIDVGKSLDDAKAVLDGGLTVGSIDLLQWPQMIDADDDTRAAAVEANAGYIREATDLGIRNFFVVMLPADTALPREENFGYMAESFARLAEAAEPTGARIVIEGWPGPGALACTPADLRALFDAVPSPVMAVNYDPSHLLRMGIDPLRFLNAFADRVAHVHAKDCDTDADKAYDLGTEQPPTFAKNPPFGGPFWRYCLPGHGQVRWVAVFEKLAAAGYDGHVSIEMEDARFNEGEADQKEALLLSRRFLEGV